MIAPNRIVIDPAICHGKPVIQGTRVPVTVVVGSLAGGMTFEDVQREYDVTADDIRSALRFVYRARFRALSHGSRISGATRGQACNCRTGPGSLSSSIDLENRRHNK